MEHSGIKFTVSNSDLQRFRFEKEEMDNCVAQTFNLLKNKMVKNESSITYSVNNEDKRSLKPYCAKFDDNSGAQDYITFNLMSKLLNDE